MCASCALLHGDTRLSVVIFFVFLFGLFLIIIIILLKLVWFFLPRAIQNVLRAQKKVFGWTGIDDRCIRICICPNTIGRIL